MHWLIHCVTKQNDGFINMYILYIHILILRIGKNIFNGINVISIPTSTKCELVAGPFDNFSIYPSCFGIKFKLCQIFFHLPIIHAYIFVEYNYIM